MSKITGYDALVIVDVSDYSNSEESPEITSNDITGSGGVTLPSITAKDKDKK